MAVQAGKANVVETLLGYGAQVHIQGKSESLKINRITITNSNNLFVVANLISRAVSRDAVAHSGPCDGRRREMRPDALEIGMRCQHQSR